MQKKEPALSDFEIGFVTSADGSSIGYRQIGNGPGLILVHGALQSSLSFTILAKALSADFTVYVIDRRGRGISDTYSADHHLLTEADDLLALINYTGAAYIFGLSAGAIVTLQTVLLCPSLKKIALYEPPIPATESQFKKFSKLKEVYENAIQRGKSGKAFIAILKATADPDFSLLNLMPSFITAPVLNMLIKMQHKNKEEDEITLLELIATFHYELILVKESVALLSQAKNIKTNVLLLGGRKSQPYFKPLLDQLQLSLQHFKRIEFKGSGHLMADNSENPLAIANSLRDFFKD